MLELSLLGGFNAASGSGAPIALPTRKTRALLAYLALHAHKPQPRETLVGLLWSDRADRQAHNSLSQALSALRKALEGVEPSPLVMDADCITFSGPAATVDALEFERLAASGGFDDLERAELLYQGDFLAGHGVRDPAFEEWADFEQQRFHALAVNALTALLGHRDEHGQSDQLVATAQRLLKLDPLQEMAHRALMRGYAWQGQAGLALKQYDTCAGILRRELGVEPEEETKRARDEIIHHRSAVSGPLSEKSAEAELPETPVRASAGRSPARRTAVMASALILLVAVAAAFWLFDRKDTPSIAVLPFKNIAIDPGQDAFVDGMTEELTTNLARISGIFVISRGTAFLYKGKDDPPCQVAEDLGVRYVLAGGIRNAGDRLRVTARLNDCPAGKILWGESFDGDRGDIFSLQDKVTRRVVEALALELLPREDWRIGLADTDNVQAHDAYLQGRSFYYRRTPADNARAASYFEQAIRLDPAYSAAYTALAKVYAQAVVGEQAYADELGIFWTEGYTRAWQLLERGMARPDADYRVLRSWLSLQKHQHDRAIAEARAALDISPHDADALEAMAEALIYAGRSDEAMPYIQDAERSNPLLLARPYYLRGLAEFASGDPGRAVEHLERAIELAPGGRTDFSGILAAAYGELDRTNEAEAAFEAYKIKFLNRPARSSTMSAQPFTNPRYHTWRRFGLAWAVYSHPFARREVLDRLARGFEKAGAWAGVGKYLPLHEENRLAGDEIKSLLFGHEINGTSFWLSESIWRQQRGTGGAVEHEGYPIHAGMDVSAEGAGRMEEDRLCEKWPLLAKTFETCVVIFRVTDPGAKTRWGDYVMVTDTGPHPFSLAE